MVKYCKQIWFHEKINLTGPGFLKGMQISVVFLGNFRSKEITFKNNTILQYLDSTELETEFSENYSISKIMR